MRTPQLFRRFQEAEIPFRASALSFHTLLSIVPIIGLVFWLLGSVGVTEKWILQLQDYIMSHLNVSSGEFFIDEFNRLALSVSGSSWGSVGLVIFVFTAGNIVLKLGNSLDRILGTARSAQEKIQNFWMSLLKRFALFLFLPVLFLVSFLVAEWLRESSWLHYLVDQRLFSFKAFAALPWGLDFLGLFTVYKFFPRHRVSFLAAAKASLVVVPIYELSKYFFSQYNHYAITTHKVYGAFSAIPIFFLWIYIVWILILSGALLMRVSSAKRN